MAQLAAKQVLRHNTAWWQACAQGKEGDPERWRSKAAWLQKQADKLWDQAEEVSRAAGHPFKNRHGETERPGPPKVGILEMVVTELRRKVECGELTWPPPA